MPKANPFAQVAKRLASLQAKSVKVNEEISVLVKIVAEEMKKLDAAPVSAKAVPGKASAKPVVKPAATKVVKTISAPKKGNRPVKK